MSYVNLNMRPPCLPAELAFLPKRGGRDVVKYEENLMPAVKDAIFGRAREAQVKPSKPLRVELATPDEVRQSTERVERVRSNSGAIREHMEERIGAMLLQLIDCHDKELYFTIGKTELQNEKTSKAQLRATNGLTIPRGASRSVAYNAAHHGTIPCIYAYPRDAYLVWKEARDPRAPEKPVSSVYMHSSDTYFCNNACTGLEDVVNRADIDLDGNATERIIEFGHNREDKKLREFSIGLLNQVARNELSPIEGFNAYFERLTRDVGDLAENEADVVRREVCTIWRDHLGGLFESYQNDGRAFIARMFGMHRALGDDATSALLDRFFPHYFKLIQRKNFYQNQLAALIRDLKERISARRETKTLTLDKAVKVVIMEELTRYDEIMQRIFRRYFCCNGTTVEQLRGEVYGPAKELVSSEESKQDVRDMLAVFGRFVANFSIDESKFQGRLLKTLRDGKGFTTRGFPAHYNRMFPGAPTLSKTQMLRIEDGSVRVLPAMAKRFALALEVPENFFLPNLVD